ncbi:MAG: hypothetical protein HKN36_10360 [Hellea sp.]|nr:hypothetical protein [Hellea sp.]
MYKNYFIKNEPQPEFKKEFISLWDGWLGKKNLDKLDEVSEAEWSKFNTMILAISSKYKVGKVDFETQTIEFPTIISETFSDYETSMNKESSEFSSYIIPELECMISEEWDYTYIIWYKNSSSLKLITPFARASGLYNFSD